MGCAHSARVLYIGGTAFFAVSGIQFLYTFGIQFLYTFAVRVRLAVRVGIDNQPPVFVANVMAVELPPILKHISALSHVADIAPWV